MIREPYKRGAPRLGRVAGDANQAPNMTTYAAPPMPANRLEPVLSALLAAVAATVVVLAGPTGGDVPAHLYRTLLVHQNVYLWDNLWFAGQYPLVSYSLLYYPVAAASGT